MAVVSSLLQAAVEEAKLRVERQLLDVAEDDDGDDETDGDGESEDEDADSAEQRGEGAPHITRTNSGVLVDRTNRSQGGAGGKVRSRNVLPDMGQFAAKSRLSCMLANAEGLAFNAENVLWQYQ
jgi:hypothetical protein